MAFSRSPRCIGRAHPRGCGADTSPYRMGRFARGSSPRVRGRFRCGDGVGEQHRLIPAGAGQIHYLRAWHIPTWAHPRGCGADVIDCHPRDRERGSSPRVRGRCRQRDATAARAGLIPAGAGQIVGPLTRYRLNGAHPRGCGADSRPYQPPLACEGSSPRVRGRLFTYAVIVIDWWAHPRGCGADH